MGTRTKEKRSLNRDITKEQLEQEYPDLANAFYLFLLKNKGILKYRVILYDYLNRYTHGTTKKKRGLTLAKILTVLKQAGYQIHIQVEATDLTEDILKDMSGREVLIAHLGATTDSIKNTFVRNAFTQPCYLIEGYFWYICKQGEELPKNRKKRMELEWVRDESAWDNFGWEIYRCKAEPEHIAKPKQIIRY